MGPNEILCQYVLMHEKGRVLAKVHGDIIGGHYGGCTSTMNILQGGLWWATMHDDSTEYAKRYDVCQRMGKPSQRDEMMLVP